MIPHLWNKPGSSLGNCPNDLLGGGAAAVPDETFLEQAKLRAQRALENVVLGDDARAWSSRPTS